MRAPGRFRRLRGVVVGVVVLGQRRVRMGLRVALVFRIQGFAVVFGVAEHEEIAAVCAFRHVDAGLVRLGDDFQIGVCLDVLGSYVGVARMRRSEAVVEPAHPGGRRLHDAVFEYAGRLLVELVLLDAVAIEDARLGSPADMQGGVDVRLRPIHDARELFPVIDVVEIEQLDGRACDDEAVEVLVFHVVEGDVERFQVLFGDVFRDVALRTEELHLDLQRRVRELSQDLRLGGDLGGHEV